jgi:hypothetical protein
MDSISADEEPPSSGRPTLEGKFAAYWGSLALERRLKRVEDGKMVLEDVYGLLLLCSRRIVTCRVCRLVWLCLRGIGIEVRNLGVLGFMIGVD